MSQLDPFWLVSFLARQKQTKSDCPSQKNGLDTQRVGGLKIPIRPALLLVDLVRFNMPTFNIT